MPDKDTAATTTIISLDIDDKLKEEATRLFSSLGMDLETAINLFLKETVSRGEIPFEYPGFSKKTLEALEEAKRISRDPSIKGYRDMDSLIKALGE